MARGAGEAFEVAIVGAGSIGIAVAYFLYQRHGVTRIAIIDPRDPMSLTSSKSGENYRNWWPHPVMAAFTNHSTDLMEEIARATDNRIAMTRRGYALATRREKPADLLEGLHGGYGTGRSDIIRMHEGGSSCYRRPNVGRWAEAPDGVDVLCGDALIQSVFPSFAKDIRTVLHIRRAGSISGQQLGQFMLETVRAAGAILVRGKVEAVSPGTAFTLDLETAEGPRRLAADRFVNAAGPFFTEIAAMLGETLPVSCVYQQKIAFEDREAAIPRDMPFSIDLDPQEIAWTEEERGLLAEDPAAARFLQRMTGGIHCRPDGAESGRWIKLGWAYNNDASDPAADEPEDPHFPDIVLRGASRLNPSLSRYIGHLPRGVHHYGGYYAMTPENWPLIGPMRTPGAFMAGALSGFGTMAACATGETCAAWIMGAALPSYATALSLARYEDKALMDELAAQSSRGVL